MGQLAIYGSKGGFPLRVTVRRILSGELSGDHRDPCGTVVLTLCLAPFYHL